VQGIVRVHLGAIDVASGPGQGTTVKVFFPAFASNNGTERARDNIENELPGIAGTVLLVEDEQALRAAASHMLRKQGFCVMDAADGSSAIDLLRNHSGGIDVVLLDLTIPGRSSDEVVAEAKRICPDIKIVVTTAYARETVTCLDAPQVKGFIRKPYRIADLVQLLRTTISS
jgi:CheY-like chemotaxis protein